jgi:hypothetical protein
MAPKGNIKPIIINGITYETSRAINRFMPHLKKELNIEYINKNIKLGKPFREKLTKSIDFFYSKQGTTKKEYLFKTKEKILSKLGGLTQQKQIFSFVNSLSK